jgi:hypothetical protein
VAVDLELYRGVTHDFIKLGRAIPEAEQAQAAGALALRRPCTGLSRISGGGQRQAAGRPGVQAEGALLRRLVLAFDHVGAQAAPLGFADQQGGTAGAVAAIGAADEHR